MVDMKLLWLYNGIRYGFHENVHNDRYCMMVGRIMLTYVMVLGMKGPSRKR